MPSGAGEAGCGTRSPEPAEDLAGANTGSWRSWRPRSLKAQMKAWALWACGRKRQVSGLSCVDCSPCWVLCIRVITATPHPTPRHQHLY